MLFEREGSACLLTRLQRSDDNALPRMRKAETTPARGGRPTVIDVANAAGVALGTVSRVLNSPESVGEELRHRVERAIEHLGYSPLRRRKGGRFVRHKSKRTGVIGVVFVGLAESLAGAQMLSEALRGIEQEVAAAGENMMLASVPGGDRVPVILTNDLVDGLIARFPFTHDWREKTNPRLLAAIERVPHVWLGGQPHGASGDTVDCDFDAVGKIAADHLHACGHRHAVCFVPHKGWLSTATPQETFSVYAKRCGITVDWWERPKTQESMWPLTLVDGGGRFERFVDDWLSLRPASRPTVMVVGTDNSATALFSILHRHSIRVGVDVSIISLCRERLSTVGLDPEVTSIDNFGETIGSRAVQQLRWRVAHADDESSSRTRIQPALLEGGSVARLNH